MRFNPVNLRPFIAEISQIYRWGILNWTALYVYLVSIAILEVSHYLQEHIFPDISQMTFKFPDFSMFSRLVATLCLTRIHPENRPLKWCMCAYVNQHYCILHSLCLSDAMNSPNGLQFLRRVENRLDKQDVSSFDQVEAVGTGVNRQQQNADVTVAPEALQILLSHNQLIV